MTKKTANQVSDKEDTMYGLFEARIPTQANAYQDNRQENLLDYFEAEQDAVEATRRQHKMGFGAWAWARISGNAGVKHNRAGLAKKKGGHVEIPTLP